MAQYEHLPIYKKALELAVYLDQSVRNFSRYNKYTIGTDLRNYTRDCLGIIIKANSSRDKREILIELVNHCEMIKTIIYFAKEVKAWQSFKAFQHASGLAVVLCKQSQGWLNSVVKSQNHKSSKK